MTVRWPPNRFRSRNRGVGTEEGWARGAEARFQPAGQVRRPWPEKLTRMTRERIGCRFRSRFCGLFHGFLLRLEMREDAMGSILFGAFLGGAAPAGGKFYFTGP